MVWKYLHGVNEMGIYKFFDTDTTGREEYDIAGEDYRNLLKTCFRYSASFSVLLSPNYEDQLHAWEPFRIPTTQYVHDVYRHYGVGTSLDFDHIGCYEVRHYKLDHCLQQLILLHADSLFKWICGWGHNNPDDIAFFRADGSVFFSSIIHEGECTIYPTMEEDVGEIVAHANWIMVE